MPPQPNNLLKMKENSKGRLIRGLSLFGIATAKSCHGPRLTRSAAARPLDWVTSIYF
jgi:hypothetical protein